MECGTCFGRLRARTAHFVNRLTLVDAVCCVTVLPRGPALLSLIYVLLPSPTSSSPHPYNQSLTHVLPARQLDWNGKGSHGRVPCLLARLLKFPLGKRVESFHNFFLSITGLAQDVIPDSVFSDIEALKFFVCEGRGWREGQSLYLFLYDTG